MSAVKQRQVKQDSAVVFDLQDRIFTIRGEKVILDSDVAELLFLPPETSLTTRLRFIHSQKI